MADQSGSERQELHFSWILFGVNWLIARKIKLIMDSHDRLLRAEKLSIKREFVELTSREFRIAQNWLTIYFFVVSIFWESLVITLPGWTSSITIKFIQTFIMFALIDSINRSKKALHGLQLEIWKSGGIASIPNLISHLPKLASWDPNDYGIDRIKLINLQLRGPKANEFVSSENKTRLAKYIEGIGRLSKKKLKLSELNNLSKT